MLKDRYPFATYVQDLYQQLKVLKKLPLPTPIQWTIDWEAVKHLAGTKGQRSRARTHEFLEALKEKKTYPAVYYFTIKKADRKVIFDIFVQAKKAAATLRINSGLKDKAFRNICHVPDNMGTSSQLYVGSVKSKIATRVQQHLGLTTSGRTGALYLWPLLQDMPMLPTITVTVYFFPQRYAALTEHMEFVFQKELQPLLGRPAVIDILPSSD